MYQRLRGVNFIMNSKEKVENLTMPDDFDRRFTAFYNFMESWGFHMTMGYEGTDDFIFSFAEGIDISSLWDFMKLPKCGTIKGDIREASDHSYMLSYQDGICCLSIAKDYVVPVISYIMVNGEYKSK